jgi:hypothetical protein
VKERRQKAMRRYRSGQRVEQGGLYVNDWGGELVLLPGDMFPNHPQMGWTGWIYAGNSALVPPRQRRTGTTPL